MTYDFTTVMDRKGKDALAVDVIPFEGAEVEEGFDRIPMWVADMNFATVPTIQEHIISRVNHPAFGYFEPSEEYYSSIIKWQKERNLVDGLEAEHIGYENGVLGCLAAAVQSFTAPGEAVLLHSPTYIGFTHVFEDNGRKMVLSDLIQDENGVWRMDYEDMDRKIKEYKIHFAVFCSPHNPTGRVWEWEEIEKAMEVYKHNNCVVISDEIWSDLILQGNHHIPTQSVSEDAKMRTIAIYAPSKTFNLAGLIGSYHIIYNPYLRDRVRKQSELCHYNSMNVLSMHAQIGGYSREGRAWLEELLDTIYGNYRYLRQRFASELPALGVAELEGTYLLWLDFSHWVKTQAEMETLLIEKCGLALDYGQWFGGESFAPFARMNLATSRENVAEACDRIIQALR